MVTGRLSHAGDLVDEHHRGGEVQDSAWPGVAAASDLVEVAPSRSGWFVPGDPPWVFRVAELVRDWGDAVLTDRDSIRRSVHA